VGGARDDGALVLPIQRGADAVGKEADRAADGVVGSAGHPLEVAAHAPGVAHREVATAASLREPAQGAIPDGPVGCGDDDDSELAVVDRAPAFGVGRDGLVGWALVDRQPSAPNASLVERSTIRSTVRLRGSVDTVRNATAMTRASARSSRSGSAKLGNTFSVGVGGRPLGSGFCAQYPAAKDRHLCADESSVEINTLGWPRR
jgi:hypothetical protein